MPAWKIEQHYTEKNSQQALSGHSRQRQHDAQRHQQNTGDVLANDLGCMYRRPWSVPELRLSILAEVVGGQLDEDYRDDTEVNQKTGKKN